MAAEDYRRPTLPEVMEMFTRHFRPVTMEEHAAIVRETLPATGPDAGRVYAN